MQESHKSILVARNGKGEFLIQDRAGHKPPAWGFFGGGIDEDETPIQALVRETKEELDIDLVDSDVIELGISETQWGDLLVVRHLFLYQTDQEEFTVLEGAGAHWLHLNRPLIGSIVKTCSKKSWYE